MQTNEIIVECGNAVKSFCNKINALDFNMQQNKKQAVWQITDKMSKIEIVFLRKESVLHAPSVLYARIFPNKNDHFFLMPHEISVFEFDSSVKPYIYPYIESAERMSCCANELLSKIISLLTKVQDYVMDRLKFEAVKEAKNQEIYRVFNIKEKDIPKPSDESFIKLYKLYEQNIVLPRLTSKESPLIYLATGKINKAKKLYSKYNRNSLSAYDKIIFEKLNKGERDFELYFPECNSICDIFPFATSSAEGLLFLKCTLLLYVIFSVISVSLVLLVTSVKVSGTVYFAGVPWYFGLIIAALPALFGGIALRQKFIPILYRKNKEKVLQTDKMINSKAVSVFAYTIFIISLVFTLFFSFMACNDTVSFYDEHLNYYRYEDFLHFSSVNVSYTDIEKVYKIEGRYNDDNDYISRDSYVLCFRDGTVLDLDGYVSVKTTEEKVLTILADFIEEPTILESDRYIPQ